MNQILVTQKLYITPELRRKKKLYKLQFFISVLVVCLLSSYYIYAEYDRNKSEEVSQQILAEVQSQNMHENTSLETEDITTRKSTDDVIIVAIEDDEELDSQIIEPTNTITTQTYTANNGATYTVEAILNIPRLSINYPIISETSEELLKISLNKYWGPGPNEVGNYCIVGHNYKNKKMFGRLNEIVSGDTVELTDMDGNTLKYTVYDKYVVDPTDVACTSQLTNGNKEVTLITCTNYGQQRLVVKARASK